MKIECAWCKAEVGEKCPNCGFPTAGLVDPRKIEDRENQFVCHHCGHTFTRGEGGTSSTICLPCTDGIGVTGRPMTERDLVEDA